MYASKDSKKALLAFLLLMVVAATSSISSPLDNQGLIISPLQHKHVSFRSSSPSTSISIPQSHGVPLARRAIPNGLPIVTTHADGWLIKYRQYISYFIPAQVAASVLEEFYTDCLRRIAKKVSRGKPDPGNAFTFNMGSVFLAFRVADPSQWIGWEGCEVIVVALLTDLRMGFTAQFRSEWYHAETDKRVYVSLSMLQRFGPRPVHD